TPGLEGWFRYGFKAAAREFWRCDHRSFAFRSGYAAHISISGPALGFGAIGLCAGPDQSRALDDQRGPALGSLSTAGESGCGESAAQRGALFSEGRADCACGL